MAMPQELDIVGRADAIGSGLIGKAATVVTVAGGGTGAAGHWLMSSDAVALFGVAVAIGGFIVNWVYKARELRIRLDAERIDHEMRMAQNAREADAHDARQRREQEEHEAKMQQILGACHGAE